MNFPLRIALRYLFANKVSGIVKTILTILFIIPLGVFYLLLKPLGLAGPLQRYFKQFNAINIITGISVLGIAVGTAALVLVLSVFNGFEDLITGMYGNFNPDVKITPIKGKTFEVDSLQMDQIYKVEGVDLVAQTLEEIAFFEYKDKQDFGTLKGVDQFYDEVTGIDTTVREGVYSLEEGARNQAVLGLGMRNKLSVNVDDQFSSMSIYMPKRKKSTGFRMGLADQQFKKRIAYPAGTFVIQQDFNNQYVLTSLDFIRDLMDYDQEVSALDIRLKDGANEAKVIRELSAIMGENYEVKNRYSQEESFMKLMQMEKWLSFAIVSLMLLLVAFNLVGVLWMIVLEKKKDIAILKSMGARDETIRSIFLTEGFLLSALGIFIGFLLALMIFLVQKSFGIVSIPGDFIIEAYPISMRGLDFLIVALTVMAIGLLASVPPALRAMRVSALIREE